MIFTNYEFKIYKSYECDNCIIYCNSDDVYFTNGYLYDVFQITNN